MATNNISDIHLPDLPETEALKEALIAATLLNANYDPEYLCDSVRRDIQRTLRGQDNKLTANPAVIARNIALITMSIRDRAEQMHSFGDIWTVGDRGSDKGEFLRAPRTTTKSVEEGLTHEADRMPANKRGRDNLEQQNTTLPGLIIIDAMKLSDNFVEKLGFGEMLAEKGSTREEKLKAKILIRPKIQEILASLEPLNNVQGSPREKNYRYFRITEGVKKGYILRVQTIAGRDRIVITTLPAAARSISHMKIQHTQERSNLRKIKRTLEEIDVELDKDWPAAKMPDRLSELLNDLQTIIGELQFVFDDDKKILCEKVKKARRWLAVENKGSARASLTGVDRVLIIDRRLKSIENIDGELAQDKLALEQRNRDEAYEVEKIYVRVRDKARKGRQPVLMNPNANMSATEQGDLANATLRMSTDCDNKVQFQPYSTFAQRIGKHLEETAGLLQAYPDKRGVIAASYMRAFVTSKIARFFNHLQLIYEDFSVHGDHLANASAPMKRLDFAKCELNTRDVANTVHVAEFTPLWKAMRRLIKKLNTLMEEFNGCHTASERKPVIEKIKNAINDFDLPGRLNAIPVLQ